ncbi:MAG TPA: acyltransferase [Phycisphaerae bacterium]|nr:acyltransferase [Phycisphaerae bacterium]
MLGPYTVLSSTNHTKLNGSYRYGPGIRKPIELKDGAWTGALSVITAGTTVGNGAAVAAGSVVTKDVPAHSIVGGVPARILKENVA